MSQPVLEDRTGSLGMPASSNSPVHPHPSLVEQRPKLKGHRRILQSLQRISSSPSLAKMGRISSSGYRSGHRGSMSCVSLSSPASGHGSSYGNYQSAYTSAAFSTAPTSVTSTPASDSQFFDSRVGIRLVETETNSRTSTAPTTAALPADIRPGVREPRYNGKSETDESPRECYTTIPIQLRRPLKQKNFDFWGELPHEIKVQIFQRLKPKEIVRCSAVSKSWYKMCFDGQLWINVDTEEYYRDIPGASLIKIMTAAGPFIRDLNLRGCVQLREKWANDGQKLLDACRNLENFSLEDCKIDREPVHRFILHNARLVHVNVSGLTALNNTTMKVIAQSCPLLEHLNVSWCPNVNARGLQKVVQSCIKLKDLRAGEIKGFDDEEFLHSLFTRNTLERLVVSQCLDLNDKSLQILMQGLNAEIDPLTDRAIVDPRRFRHLDFSRCRALTDQGIQFLAHNVPDLCGLQLSHCDGLTDEALAGVLDSAPYLTHLDLEELDDLSNVTLHNIAKSPCAKTLQHLNLSYCESLGDSGMLAVLKSCTGLRNLIMDNTRVSNLALVEAALQICNRNHSYGPSAPCSSTPVLQMTPTVGLHLIVYDCQNVTWTGIREVLYRNAEPPYPFRANISPQIVSLKCFCGYQATVDEHTKRILRGDIAAARRLEKKWAEYMVASEDAGATGAGSRRRRRRLREAAAVHADEEEGGPRGGRRRARSGGCIMM